MRLRTLFLYLIGNRQAILDIAAEPRWLGFGGLLVLSAAFAREYDGEDLVHEPWHLLIPFAASLLTSLVLFGLTFGILTRHPKPRPTAGTAYRAFLTLFWLTAPLAWLYAIPYERFLSPLEATRANLWTLALVSLWRVALMVRVVHVLMGYSIAAAFMLVMTVADAEALLAIQFVPFPLMSMMGGIRITESEVVLQGAILLVQIFGWVTLPVWLIGMGIVAMRSKPAWQGPVQAPRQPGGISWPLRLVVGGALAIWLFILPRTQPEQILRYRAERLLKHGRVAEALTEMSAHEQEEFPPHWDPPPRMRRGQDVPSYIQVAEALGQTTPAPWVQAMFMTKLDAALRSFEYWSHENLDLFVDFLSRFPEGRHLLEHVEMDRKFYDHFVKEVIQNRLKKPATSP